LFVFFAIVLSVLLRFTDTDTLWYLQTLHSPNLNNCQAQLKVDMLLFIYETENIICVKKLDRKKTYFFIRFFGSKKSKGPEILHFSQNDHSKKMLNYAITLKMKKPSICWQQYHSINL
jgi:hypothetical protein